MKEIIIILIVIACVLPGIVVHMHRKPVRPHCNCRMYAPDVDKDGWCKECRPNESEE